MKLLLTLQALLYEEIIRGCRELEAFIVRYNQGLADGDTAALVQQRLLQTHQDLNDFESRLTQNLGPLHLPNPLLPNTGKTAQGITGHQVAGDDQQIDIQHRASALGSRRRAVSGPEPRL